MDPSRPSHLKHREALREELAAELTTMGLRPGPVVLDRCLDYWELLKNANQRLNLISSEDLKEGAVRHIGDALAALAHWFPPAPGRLLDVGSGGGLPGIPLALAAPDLKATLLESRERKSDWLARILRGLDVADRVRVRTGRVEEQSPEWVGGFDLLTARAVAPPDRILDWCAPLMRPGQVLLLWQSDEQQTRLGEIIAKSRYSNVLTVTHTLSYQFTSISFTSNINSIMRTH